MTSEPQPRVEMLNILRELLVNFDGIGQGNTSIMNWACPIISFGDPNFSNVATLGLNPSNLEFVDQYGSELQGPLRRFHSLYSLGLNKWKEALDTDLMFLLDSFYGYFNHNPYDNWFKKLDYIISGSSYSYYFPFCNACHLDLVPFATSVKWGYLSKKEQTQLLQVSQKYFAHILKWSRIHTIILNGRSVVDGLQVISGVLFKETQMPLWNLPRQNGQEVLGYAYEGFIDKIGPIALNKEIKVLGYNHNIQSSFGVTSQVQSEIRKWIKINI